MLGILRTLTIALALFAGCVSLAAPGFAQVQQNVEIASLAGSYAVQGRNPDGSAYSGSLSLTVLDGVANLTWAVGNRIYKGQGTFIGNVLVVNWGSSSPVLYTVDLQGNLAGTWDRGRASERLIRQ